MPRGGGSKTHKRSILRADEANRALDLKRDGFSFRRIAAELGCDVDKAFKLVTQALESHPVENLRELRLVEGEKLDASEARLLEIVETFLPSVTKGKVALRLAAAKTVYEAEARLDAVRARRHKLLGANAPERTESTVTIGSAVTPAEARKVMSELFPGNVGPDVGASADDGCAPPVPPVE